MSAAVHKKAGRGARFYSPSDHILSRVTTSGHQMLASSFFPGHQHSFMSGSPLFATNSLPVSTNNTMIPQRDFSDSGESSIQANRFEFVSDFRETPQVYPSIVIGGMIVDVNDAVREIVTNRPPAPAVSDTTPASSICPISYVPITAPGRGVACQHSQCFDLAEFLILQGDQEWICPVCGIPLDFESLRFDPAFMKEKCDEFMHTEASLFNDQLKPSNWHEFGLDADEF